MHASFENRYLLSEAHSGYDLPWQSHNVFPEILGGSPRHQKHHENGKVYYQQYFKYLDDFFGFVDEDSSHEYAAKESISVKGGSPDAIDETTV